MILIGSAALEIEFKKVGLKLDRTPVDYDFLCTKAEMGTFGAAAGLTDYPHWLGNNGKKATAQAKDGRNFEFEFLETSLSSGLYAQYLGAMRTPEKILLYGQPVMIAPIEVLYSIKRSHRHYPRQFHKNVQDYLRLKRVVGEDRLDRITFIREQETKDRYAIKAPPSLNKKTEDFFNDDVSNKTFVHDEIHGVMAHREKPMFEYIKIDPNLVKCSREKFEALSNIDRLRCVLEEAYVIALERAIIPMIFTEGPPATPKRALDWALMRICTNLCSGWFREFALDNYNDLLLYSNQSYVSKFLQAVDEGRIKRIEK